MTRIKRGMMVHKRHKKVLALTKGYKWLRKNTFKMAKQASMKAGTHSYRSRKFRKRDFRHLWIQRINNALLAYNLQYSRFIYKLQNSHVRLNRKMLAMLAVDSPEVFKEIVKKIS